MGIDINSNLYFVLFVILLMLVVRLMWLMILMFDWEICGFKVVEVLVLFVWYGWLFMIYLVSVIDVCYCLGMLMVKDDVDIMDLVLWLKLLRLVF